LEVREGSADGFARAHGIALFERVRRNRLGVIAHAQSVAPFMSVDDFVRRTTLSEDLLGLDSNGASSYPL
jgi:hypothetical protein